MLEVVVGNRLRDVSREVIGRIDLSDSLESENFIVVPDRFSLIAEKIIFEELGIISSFNVEVVGISQLAQSILDNECVLDPNECKLLILNILKKNKFNSFKNPSLTLADEFYKIISQLKSNNISCEAFFDSVKDKDDKLKDISNIYNLYQIELAGRLDQNDMLSKFTESIKENNFNYFFVEFDSLTEQGGLILEKLIKNAKRVVVGATLPNKQKNSYLYDNDIFFKINKICRNNKIEAKKVFIDNKINEKQLHLLQNLYAISPQKMENGNVYLMQFSTPEKEIENVCKIILSQIKKGKRFKDFNILTTNIKDKESVFERIFTQYNVPYFIDTGVLAENLIPVQFLKLLFNYLIEDSEENFVCLIKNYYSQIGFEEVCDIENQISKSGEFNIENFAEKSVIEFVEKINAIKEIFSKSQNNLEYIEVIKKSLEIFKIEELTKLLINELKEKGELKLEKIYQQIINRINTTLELIKDNLKEINDFEEVVDIFLTLLNDKEIFSVPASVDSVFVGDAVNSYFEEREYLFVVGATQNALPVIQKDYSILSDNDIDSLSSSVLINPTIKLINKRNKFKLFQNLTLGDMIYISFSSSALGEKTEPSSLISEVQKIFVRNGEKIFIINDFFEEIAKEKLEEESYLDIQTYSNYEEELLYLVNNKNLTVKSLKDILQSNEKFLNKDLKNYIFSFPDDEFIRNILDKYFSPQSVEKIDCSKDLYFYKNNISASQIEKFYKCPFKFFFTSGLKLKENEKCEFDDRDIGNYFHHVSENFVKRNSERLGNMSEKEIEQELNKISQILYKDERFDRLTKCLKNKHMVAKLKNEALMLLSKVNYEQKWTDFVSKFVEKGFRCPIENTDFKLTGFIDRVDVSDKDFRVIDYKSGEIGQSLANVFYGVELQLFIYMIAIKNELGLKPAGAFYLPVGSDFAKDKSLKKLILSGFVLSENSILKKLDKRFNKQNLTSDIINLKLSASDGELTCSTKSKNVFTEDGLNSVMEYVKLLTKETINKMLEGKIWATPLKSKNRLECSNCEFYAICSFSGENNGGVPRQVSGEMKQEDFIDIIKGKEKNAGQI